MAYTSPTYLTSQLYPINVIEQMNSGITATLLASPYYGNWVNLPDQLNTTLAINSGTMSYFGTISYTNWPNLPDQLNSTLAINSGTLPLSLVSYSNWPNLPDQLNSSLAINSGTLM
jgi:hypothetical protein